MESILILQEFDVCHQTHLVNRDQPSSQVFNKFDKLLLMAEGQGMYLGDVKNCKTLPTIPTETFAVVTRSEDECRQRISAICENFEESEWAQSIRAEIKSIENQMAENVKRLGHPGESSSGSP